MKAFLNKLSDPLGIVVVATIFAASGKLVIVAPFLVGTVAVLSFVQGNKKRGIIFTVLTVLFFALAVWIGGNMFPHAFTNVIVSKG